MELFYCLAVESNGLKKNLVIIKITLNLLQKFSHFGCRISAPFFLLFTISSFSALAGTPVELRDELGWAGHGNFVGTAASFRTSATQCGTTTSATGQLHGIPIGATVAKAHLYWASSGQTADHTVTFSNGTVTSAVTAAIDRRYTEVIQTYNYPYYSGAADVTTLVQSMIGVASGGSYTFTLSALNIQQPPGLCEYLLMAGWSLIVVYEEPNEPLRLINVFEGFDEFWNESLTLTPKNFRVPANADLPGAGVNRGKHAHITWEGDENRTDVNENLIFEGQTLSFSSNPINNQFNSTIADETLPAATWQTNVYGVDLDTYDITPLVSADAMQVTTVYKSGDDMVLLSAEVLSILNVEVADVAIGEGVSANPITSRASNAEIRVVIDNNGPFSTAGSLTATIDLKTELTLNGTAPFTSNGWSCVLTIAPSTIECSKAVNYANGAQDYFDIPVTVSATAPTNISVDVFIPGTVADPYPVVGGEFDNVTSNNSNTFNYILQTGDLASSTKTYLDNNGNLTEAGDTITYQINVIESNGVATHGISISDPLDAQLTNLNVISLPSGTDNSTGSVFNVDDISIGANQTLTFEYKVDIIGSANVGDAILNSATISFPGGADVVVQRTITVASLNPQDTVKKLYLYSANLNAPHASGASTRPHLSRVAPSSNDGNFAFAKNQNNEQCVDDLSNGFCKVWTLDPALISKLNVNSVNIDLLMKERGGGSTSNINLYIALLGNGNSIIADGTFSRTIDDNWSIEQFGLSVSQPQGFSPGESLTLLVQNNDPHNTDRFIIRSYQNSNLSQLLIDTDDVINVDSIKFYDSAHACSNPSNTGNEISSIELPEDADITTIFGRAVISDPFGAFDITQVFATLSDPSTSLIYTDDTATNLIMLDNTCVTDLTAGQVLVEFNYSIDKDSATGTWQNSFKAEEGFEGPVDNRDIYHIEIANFSVYVPPELTVTKDVFLFSNPGSPITQAKIGDLLQYQILIENNSAGDAGTVSVTDNISQYSAFIFNSNNSLDDSLSCLDCGAAGLTYVEPSYSADDGSSFTHPVVISQDGNNNNIDSNITNFKLDLTGTFIAGDSITFTYQVVVK